MDDPFSFHKSIESGEFKLEGVGKLYGQEEPSPLDGMDFRFTLVERLTGEISGDVALTPIDIPQDMYQRINMAFNKTREKVFVALFRLEGLVQGTCISIEEISISSYDIFNCVLYGSFMRFRLGRGANYYNTCLGWVPNLEFVGREISKYVEKGVVTSTFDYCKFEFNNHSSKIIIELKQLRNYHKTLEVLNQQKTSALTSVCSIFAEKKSEKFFYESFQNLFKTVSFAEGRLVLPLAYWFQGDTDLLLIENLIITPYRKIFTWCSLLDPRDLAEAINELFPRFSTLPSKRKKLISDLIYQYLAFHESTLVEVQYTFLSRMYEKLVSKNGLLSTEQRVHPMDEKVKEIFVRQIEETIQELLGDSASIFLERIDTLVSMLLEKPFREKIETLFMDQGFTFDKKMMAEFIRFRNIVAHGGQIKKKGFPKALLVLQYMLRFIEIIVLDYLHYSGMFEDRWRLYEKHEKDSKGKPRTRVPFSIILNQLMIQK